MLGSFLRLELRLRFRALSTYVYFLLFFALMLLAMSARDFGFVSGKILLNGPFGLTMAFTQVSALGAILIAGIMGPAILRDFQTEMYPLIFTKPVPKYAYLGGRFLGSQLTALFIFSGLIFGAMAGTLMPWADREKLGPVHLWTHLQPFLVICVVQLFALGSLFFCVAALTRRLIVVYLQGVVLFAIYLILLTIVITPNKIQVWPAIFDPLGLVLLTKVARYWTVAEKNSQLFSMSGIFLANRLLWLGVGVAALGITWRFFPMSAEQLTARRAGRKARTPDPEQAQARPGERRLAAAVPARALQPSALAQLVSLTRLRFFNIVREPVFWAITLAMVALGLANGRFAGEQSGSVVWPVTYLMVQAVQGSAGLFLFIVATLYAGELVWRERDVRFDQIHDALPLRDYIDWWSRLLALCGVELVLLTVVGLCGVVMQAAAGYFRFELLLYAKELYLVQFPQVLIFILLALFAHTVLSNKFAAHAAVIGFVVAVPILYRYGIENRLVLYGEITPYIYSDLNGYGHFVAALFWSIAYWLLAGAVLGVVSIALARRGTGVELRARLRQARSRLPALLPAGSVFLVMMAGAGAYFYYNTHVRNEFRTAQEQRHRQADYERLYKKYKWLAQPKVTAVDVAVDIYPEQRAFAATGHYQVENRSGQPIAEIHVTDAKEAIAEVRFDRPARLTLGDKKHFYSIYTLDPPLAPGAQLRIDFRSGYAARGFKDGGERPEIAENGTFFDRDYFPQLGYVEGLELDDPGRRREEKLPPLAEMPERGDPRASRVNLFTPDSEWITFRATVSTAPDQIAIAPGYLQREWTEGGRRKFEYSQGETRINNFFSFLSGRFAVRRDKWKDVDIEIYYHPGHAYNLDKMIESTKSGLTYFEQSFGPYQFRQFRVLEFPRYRTFAQSFPNTVPYSEAIGFLGRLKKPDDIDLLYFVTAHELAHQWWGHQLIGSATQGSNMMSESLAEYSALKVMEKRYGAASVRKFLRYELDGYLRGRGQETRREPPLSLVQREPYVWYQKGSLALFALADYLGEERLNAALRGFLEKNRYASGTYPDTRAFVDALRAAAPPELRYLVEDLFESIVLYDNRAVRAAATEAPAGKYKVTLELSAQKRKADGAGNESPLALNDVIELGVFAGTKEDLKPLYLAKHRLAQQTTTIELLVDGRPTFAGIDPYHRLIDRNPEDNLIAVEGK